jgi:hypothetical protein
MPYTAIYSIMKDETNLYISYWFTFEYGSPDNFNIYKDPSTTLNGQTTYVGITQIDPQNIILNEQSYAVKQYLDNQHLDKQLSDIAESINAKYPLEYYNDKVKKYNLKNYSPFISKISLDVINSLAQPLNLKHGTRSVQITIPNNPNQYNIVEITDYRSNTECCIII